MELLPYATFLGKRGGGFELRRFTYFQQTKENHICEHISMNICLNYNNYKFILSKFSYFFYDQYEYYSFDYDGSVKWKPKPNSPKMAANFSKSLENQSIEF